MLWTWSYRNSASIRPERAEQSREQWNVDAGNAEGAGEFGGVNRTGAAEGNQSELTRVASPLGGDGANRPRHRSIGDPMDAVGSRLLSKAEWADELFVDCTVSGVEVNRNGAAGDALGIHVAKDDAGVGDGGFDAAIAIAGGARQCTGAARADAHHAACVAPCQTAAAGADFDDIVGGDAERITGSAAETPGNVDAATDFTFGTFDRLAVLDEAGLDRGATHIEGDGLVEFDGAGQ
jgi:hypothetical protein